MAKNWHTVPEEKDSIYARGYLKGMADHIKLSQPLGTTPFQLLWTALKGKESIVMNAILYEFDREYGIQRLTKTQKEELSDLIDKLQTSVEVVGSGSGTPGGAPSKSRFQKRKK